MLLLNCPWCGLRSKSEFSGHGQAHIRRPLETPMMTDVEWGTYVFFQDNPAGYFRELWRHDYGCNRWFHAIRDTRIDTTLATYEPHGPVPAYPEPVAPDGDAGENVNDQRDPTRNG